MYLDVTRKIPNRKTLVKLRISNHKRKNKQVRYDKISRCDRICPVCGLNIEDEIQLSFQKLWQTCQTSRNDKKPSKAN